MNTEPQPRTKIQSGCDMIYLAACALHNEVPSSERIRAMDFPEVYRISKAHTMQAITWMAIELWLAENRNDTDVIAADLREKWAEAKAKAIRKNILFEAEREKLFAFMDGQNIWYMPLKGVLLQGYYPAYGMRQMVDNDILFDSAHRETICSYFLSNGYTVSEELAEAHDVYQKKPVYNFEMHFFLYRPYRNHDRHEYYKDVKERLIHREGDHPLEYRFTDEDFYIYCTAHAFKHFINGGGVGVRALMDVYVYLASMEDRLNWQYIEEECEKLGMTEYQHYARKISKIIFGELSHTIGTPADPLTEKEHSILSYYITSGAHGTRDQYIIQEIRAMTGTDSEITRKSKVKYLLRRVFPTREYIARTYPFFDHHPYLIPFLIVYRVFRSMICYPGKLMKELKLVWQTKN